MKKSNIAAAVCMALGAASALTSVTANASLTSSAVLSYTLGSSLCISGCTDPNPANQTYDVTAGSYFGMDANASGTITAAEKTAIGSHDGIHIGFTSSATGSHTGTPFGAANNYTGTNYIQTGMTSSGAPLYMLDGNGNKVVTTTTEVPGVDEPWGFFGNTGMDYLTKAVTQVGTQTGTRKFLDFSGWTVTWNGIGAIPMNAGAWSTGTNFGGSGGNGVARIDCSAASCSTSSTYTLDYYATVPVGDPSGFGGVKYQLHLVGHVGTAVPVPAAAWLLGSGLVGLVGVARRKKSV